MQILERVLLAEQPTQVVYLGDGRGDFCPCTRLGPTDVILARSRYPDDRPASLLQLLAAESASIRGADGARSPTSPPLPPPPPSPTGQQPAGGGSGLANHPAVAVNETSSSSAAWTAGGRWPEGHTATLVRHLAADAAEHLNPSGLAAGPQPALRPLARSMNGSGQANGQAAEGAEDAVAQRRNHQNPEAGQEDDVATLQVAAEIVHPSCQTSLQMYLSAIKLRVFFFSGCESERPAFVWQL